MRKILIISYYFPPVPAIGSQRPYNLAKYFPQFGWEPIVLTPTREGAPSNEMRIIGTDYRDVIAGWKERFGFNSNEGLQEQIGIGTAFRNYTHRSLRSKVVKFLKECVAFPDEHVGWHRFACRAASEVIDREGIDVILSTSPPAVTHLIARDLKRRYHIPWVADFRDPWSQKYSGSKSYLIGKLEKNLEERTIADADALVSVTRPYVDRISSIHRNRMVHCITNGYDEDDFQDSPPSLTEKFTITYTGDLYNGKRDPSLLLEAIAELLEQNRIERDRIELRFYTRKYDWLHREIEMRHLNGVVRLCGLVSRKEALARQRESQLLLLVRWNCSYDRGDCPAKIYEYLGAKRPIIAIGGCGGIIQEMLESTNAGRFASNVHELKKVLLQYYDEFLAAGSVTCSSNGKISKYAYSSVTRSYAELLNMMVESG